MYKVEFTKQAIKQLNKLDKPTAAMITGWVHKNLEDCDNPRIHGKGLTANRSGEWRYRIGDYRLIAQIKDDIVTIMVLTVGHRRDVYKFRDS